jgi:predicted ester cyclase
MKGSNRILRWCGLLLTAALLGAVVQCGQGGPEVVTEPQARRLIDGYLAFRNEGNLTSANEVIHPDCSINYPNVPGYIKGLDAFKEYNRVTRIAFPDFKMSVYDFFVEGNRIVSLWSLSATNSGPLASPIGELPPTNREIRVTGMAVSRVEDGKIVEDVAYFDTADMLKQLGFQMVPPLAQTEE